MKKSMYELLIPEIKEKLISLAETSIEHVKAQYVRAIDDLKNKHHTSHLELSTCMKIMNALGEGYDNLITYTILSFNDGE